MDLYRRAGDLVELSWLPNHRFVALGSCSLIDIDDVESGYFCIYPTENDHEYIRIVERQAISGAELEGLIRIRESTDGGSVMDVELNIAYLRDRFRKEVME